MCYVIGEVRDCDGHVNYRIVGAWDTALELFSADGKSAVSMYLSFTCRMN